jgi:hypothetical protein
VGKAKALRRRYRQRRAVIVERNEPASCVDETDFHGRTDMIAVTIGNSGRHLQIKRVAVEDMQERLLVELRGVLGRLRIAELRRVVINCEELIDRDVRRREIGVHQGDTECDVLVVRGGVAIADNAPFDDSVAYLKEFDFPGSIAKVFERGTDPSGCGQIRSCRSRLA